MDRNSDVESSDSGADVALRKESVDRNTTTVNERGLTWVALRKESVDRNAFDSALDGAIRGRSPQGERG